MTESMTARWNAYRPTKGGLVWSFLAGVVATLVVGFWGFNWYSEGGAEALARHAAVDARVKLASGICVERFMKAPDAAAQLAALKKESRYSRDRFIEDGGWVDFARRDTPVYGAAGPCAETLLKMKNPKVDAAASSES